MQFSYFSCLIRYNSVTSTGAMDVVTDEAKLNAHSAQPVI